MKLFSKHLPASAHCLDLRTLNLIYPEEMNQVKGKLKFKKREEFS
jgi:hypothetical protein